MLGLVAVIYKFIDLLIYLNGPALHEDMYDSEDKHALYSHIVQNDEFNERQRNG